VFNNSSSDGPRSLANINFMANGAINPIMIQHMQSHATEERHQFKWRVITTNKFTGTRLAIEALHIKLHTGHLMNGCGGIHLLSFL
jgi:hypothetical protein